MTNDEQFSEDESEQDLPVEDETNAGGSPFAVGPVDALVFSKDHDLPPELRPAANLIPAASREPSFPNTLPTAPDNTPQPVWTPGLLADEYHEPEPAAASNARTGRFSSGLASLLLALPLVVIGVVIWYAVTHLIPH
jgi:hypothetical protein